MQASEKIFVKQGSFGSIYRFENTPEEWEGETGIWFTVWAPGEIDTPIVQRECTFDTYWQFLSEAGDFDEVGIYHYELAWYVEGERRDPSFSGELEVLEGPKMPEAPDE